MVHRDDVRFLSDHWHGSRVVQLHVQRYEIRVLLFNFRTDGSIRVVVVVVTTLQAERGKSIKTDQFEISLS